MMDHLYALVCLLSVALALSACATGNTGRPATAAGRLTDRQLAVLARHKIFFGHQSVGDNIIEGIREAEALDPRLQLPITSSSEPNLIAHSGLIETHLGTNGNPGSKFDAFGATLDRGMGAEGGIAMFKLCYVDVNAATDVARLFAHYSRNIDSLKSKYPALKIVHVTVPLTTAEGALRAWANALLRRPGAREANIKRNQFNDLLRKTYAGSDPIFDLAGVESTRPGGARSYFMRAGKRIYTLAPEYAADSGHLNQAGRMVAAEQLLSVLSGI